MLNDIESLACYDPSLLIRVSHRSVQPFRWLLQYGCSALMTRAHLLLLLLNPLILLYLLLHDLNGLVVCAFCNPLVAAFDRLLPALLILSPFGSAFAFPSVRTLLLNRITEIIVYVLDD